MTVRSATDPVEAKRRDLISPMQTEPAGVVLLVAQDLHEKLAVANDERERERERE